MRTLSALSPRRATAGPMCPYRIGRSVVVATLLAVLAGSGCSKGSSASAPSTPTPTPAAPQPVSVSVTALNGLTGARVSGVTVSTSAGSSTTDASGVAVVSNGGSSRFNLKFEKDGFTVFTTMYDGSRTEFSLWPITAPNSDTIIKEMVFGDTTAHNNPGLRPMARLDKSVELVLSAEVAADPALVAQIADAILIWNSASSNPSVQTRFANPITGPAGSSGVAIAMEVDPSIGYQGLTYLEVKNGVIRSGKIQFKNIPLAVGTPLLVRHEMLHLFGTWHHSGTGIIGTIVAGYVPTQLEIDNIRMMFLRRPSTIYPDDERPTYTLSSAPTGYTGTIVFRCSLPAR